MEKIKAILVDDELPALSSLEILLREYCPEVEVVGTSRNVENAITLIDAKRPDVVFLDIEMPEYNGFELLKMVEQIDFDVIFVSAYNEYVLKAFEVSSLDYLLKPVDINGLMNAVKKAQKSRDSKLLQMRFRLMETSIKQGTFSKIALPVLGGYDFVELSDILYLKADGAYTEIIMKNNERKLISKKIKFFEEVLSDKPHFYRCHRSYMVNLNGIKKYIKSESMIILDFGNPVPIAQDRKAEFDLVLKQNKLLVG